MPQFNLFDIISYLTVINLLTVVTTIYDKNAAITGKWRISEKTLLTVAVLGGAVSMYAFMRIIHHKTRNPVFMFGLPLIVVLQILGCFLYYK